MGISWEERLLNEHQRAGGVIRLVAAFYDLIFIGLIMIGFGILSTYWMVIQSESPSEDFATIRRYIMENEFHLYVVNWVFLCAVFLIVHIIIAIRGRRTMGMIIADLHLYNENAEQPSFIQFLLRELLKYVLFPFYLMSFTKKKRTLYDKLTKTYLIK